MVNRKELNPEASPEAAYGARLRSAREARGWRQDDLADRIGYSGRHVSGVETTRKSPSRPFSVAVDIALELVGTAESFERQWGEIRHGALLNGFPEYVVHEGRAVEIRLYDVGIIPGLLQTPEYAQAQEDGHVERGAITGEQASERVAFLAGRQAALFRPKPPMMFVVMDESCLHHAVGGPSVMRAQLQHLVDVAARPNWIIQVAPHSLGARRSFNLPVNLLTLTDRSVICYAESQSQGHLDRSSASVMPMLTAYHQLQGEALSPAASVAMINQTRKGLP
ncbi:helix-turn-helix domain-containing protein [Streptomyces bohaiensis]|uniref:Helix-turn-helix domain-containing protein n=1 Tax=Streptomyces bohaiensis TaxID=1431344 RepID=A0ABX1CFJ2_9ACTN|nr:helix-turn-helix transcriptional regulator [Streptomyces bohaiensis]NJQ15139.1 helix-turn-helix domain-containing protein [Streptomyces bohaiensis]